MKTVSGVGAKETLPRVHFTCRPHVFTHRRLSSMIVCRSFVVGDCFLKDTVLLIFVDPSVDQCNSQPGLEVQVDPWSPSSPSDPETHITVTSLVTEGPVEGHNTTQHHRTEHKITQHNTTQRNTTQQNTTTQYNTTQKNTVNCVSPLFDSEPYRITWLPSWPLRSFGSLQKKTKKHNMNVQEDDDVSV